ncbi:hypothetical protein KFU94_34305 [Chloroflexi bacterium TSY]|nr:hypothetical protein [Chloroflexi bacterium TSY]
MIRKISLIVVWVTVTCLLFVIDTNISEAAEWHHPANTGWSIGKVCHDGVLLKATDQFAIDNPDHAASAEIFDIRVHHYQGEDVNEIVSIIAMPNETDLGAPVGSTTLGLTKNSYPTLVTDVLANPGTHVTYVFTTKNLYWPQIERGETLIITLHNLDGSFRNGGYFLAPVEDCSLAPDAPTKSPDLAFTASVGRLPGNCTGRSSLTAFPSLPAYACLIVENRGDDTFTGHMVPNTIEPIAPSFALTITPGAKISITHEIAKQAGLDINLGPFRDKNNIQITFTWYAEGAGQPISRIATININRFGSASSIDSIYLPVMIGVTTKDIN